MNNKSVTIKSDILIETLGELEKKGLKSLRNKLLLAIPEHFFKEGSKLWWERSDLEAREDIKHGRITTIRSEKELDTFFQQVQK